MPGKGYTPHACQMKDHASNRGRHSGAVAIRAYPSEDLEFHALVRKSVSRALGRGQRASLADRVQVAVRMGYPGCRVRVHDSVATGQEDLVVHAYREGTLGRSTGAEPVAVGGTMHRPVAEAR